MKTKKVGIFKTQTGTTFYVGRVLIQPSREVWARVDQAVTEQWLPAWARQEIAPKVLSTWTS